MTNIIDQLQKAWPQISLTTSDLSGKVVETLSAPGKNPQQTAIVVFGALVIFLLVSTLLELVLSLFFGDETDETEADNEEASSAGSSNAAIEEDKPAARVATEGTTRENPTGWRTWVVITAGVIALVAGGTLYGTSQSKLCSLACHEMATASGSWTASTHKNVACIDCHRKPGIFGFAATKVDLARMVAINRSGNAASPINATLQQESCSDCHSEIFTKTVTVRSIRVSHKEIVAAGYSCSDCHSSVGHAPKTAEIGRRKMNTCLACHGVNKTAKADCSTCHVKDAGVAVSRPPAEFPKVTLDSARCKGCHDITKCTNCHGVEMPHSVEWRTKGMHAKYAAFEKKEVCKKCHTESFCGSCHKFPGHNTTYWKQAHKVSRESEPKCMGCHSKDKSPIFCGLCHADNEVLIDKLVE